ncbi:MAG: hypothetical protein K6F91_00035, partial [Ruminococcus sp.]|nr:hypothetical protein [Ruminococcus sp.]
ERKDLAKRCSESIVDNYIRKIREWQIKNHKLNACPFITIGKWIEEDRGKSIYGSNQSYQSNSSPSDQRYKGNNGKPIYESGGVIRNLNIATMTSEEYDAYAASIDLSKVTT